MKKGLILLVLVLSFLLSGCAWTQSYDDIYAHYEDHLENNGQKYLERINLLNDISNDALKGVVRVKKLSSNKVTNTFGSGLIFDEDPVYYYVLTNHHIVYDQRIEESVYTVYDYKHNAYSANFVAGSNLHDLAVLRIKKKAEPLRIFSFALDNPSTNTHLITMGYPESQSNTIHMGTVLDYGTVNIDVDDSIINVTFDVIVADIPVKSGSSGSAVLNDSFYLVGIVFAGNFPDDSDIADYAFMIPIVRVKEFLTENEFKYNEVTS